MIYNELDYNFDFHAHFQASAFEIINCPQNYGYKTTEEFADKVAELFCAELKQKHKEWVFALEERQRRIERCIKTLIFTYPKNESVGGLDVILASLQRYELTDGGNTIKLNVASLKN